MSNPQRASSNPAHAALTHVDDHGRVHMVDVSTKPVTSRRAAASAVVRVGAELLQRITAGQIAKGEVLTVAKLAGIMAAKRTAELIPLCHGLAADFIDVQITPQPPDTLVIRAEARIDARTGVEMEALVAASLAALTIYDMCKAASREIVIGPIQLEEKSGGKSGTWRRSTMGPAPPAPPHR